MLRYDRQIEPGLVTLYDMRPEMERVYSYNPGARTGLPCPVVSAYMEETIDSLGTKSMDANGQPLKTFPHYGSIILPNSVAQ